MRRRGYDPTTLKPIAPGGQQTQTPTPAQPGHMTFKRTATGPNNHKIGTNDVDASGHPLPNAVWVDVVTGKNI
jgi:hypothetical protein